MLRIPARGRRGLAQADHIALCCLTDEVVFAQVRRACASLKLHAVRLPLSVALSPKAAPRVALLIYDLEGSPPRVALDVVHRLRSLYPSRPLLAYVKPGRLAAGLAARLGRLPGVTTWAQLPDAPEDVDTLRRLLRGLIAQAPDLLIRTLTAVLLHQSPARMLWRFVDALLARLAQGEPGAPPVADIVERAKPHARALRRTCRAARAPGPERLTEWLTFIYVIATAEWEGVSVARAAATVGVSARYVRQLRASLVPEIPALRGTLAHYALTHAIMRLGEECGWSPQQAAQAAGRIVGGDGES
jgi:hypothetical protein